MFSSTTFNRLSTLRKSATEASKLFSQATQSTIQYTSETLQSAKDSTINTLDRINKNPTLIEIADNLGEKIQYTASTLKNTADAVKATFEIDEEYYSDSYDSQSYYSESSYEDENNTIDAIPQEKTQTQKLLEAYQNELLNDHRRKEENKKLGITYDSTPSINIKEFGKNFIKNSSINSIEKAKLLESKTSINGLSITSLNQLKQSKNKLKSVKNLQSSTNTISSTRKSKLSLHTLKSKKNKGEEDAKSLRYDEKEREKSKNKFQYFIEMSKAALPFLEILSKENEQSEQKSGSDSQSTINNEEKELKIYTIESSELLPSNTQNPDNPQDLSKKYDLKTSSQILCETIAIIDELKKLNQEDQEDISIHSEKSKNNQSKNFLNMNNSSFEAKMNKLTDFSKSFSKTPKKPSKAKKTLAFLSCGLCSSSIDRKKSKEL